MKLIFQSYSKKKNHSVLSVFHACHISRILKQSFALLSISIYIYIERCTHLGHVIPVICSREWPFPKPNESWMIQAHPALSELVCMYLQAIYNLAVIGISQAFSGYSAHHEQHFSRCVTPAVIKDLSEVNLILGYETL